MEIKKTSEGSKLILALEGSLDTVTAPDLATELKAGYGRVKDIVIDMEKLDYLTSAGLRVLLSAQKVMNKQGSMIICNVNEEINEIFKLTGFIDVLTIR